MDVDRRGATAVRSAPAAAPGPVPGLLAVAAAGVGLAALLWVLAGVVGRDLTTRSVLAVAVLTAVHCGLVALALPRAGAAVRVLVGAVVGLAVAGTAVWLSGLAGWAGLRWVVVAAPALAWLLPAARTGWRSPAEDRWARLARHAPALWGLAGAWLLAAPVLADRIGPSAGAGPFRVYYVDTTWHVALTAEAMARAPEVYPWIPDVPIGYSWLFFGTLGLLGNATGATAAQVVLAIGPTLMAVLVPVALAGCAWVVSRSRLATALAPVLFAVMRGPVLATVEQVQQTPGWVLINRDSTNALVLAVVVVLVLQVRTPRGPRGAGAASVLLLFGLTFAAAGGRGGAVLPVLGAVGLTWLAWLRDRDRRLLLTWSSVAVVVAVVGATLGVTRSSGSFRVEPLSFLPAGATVGLEGPLLPVASVAVMVVMTGALLLLHRWTPHAAAAQPALVGGALAGVLGLAVFGHPSFSQLYFFHACWPLLVVGMAVLLAGAVRALGPLVLAPVAAAVVATQLVLQPPAALPATPWPVRAGLGAALVVAGLVVVALAVARRHGGLRPVAWALPVLVLALQPWALPEVLHASVTVEAAPSESTVSDGQLAVMAELRERSDPEDLVVTNKHCLHGDVGACDARWFTVAAFSERRVLVEGWSYDYTWTSSGNDAAGYDDPALLAANDELIAAPSPASCARMRAEGVRWVYVDEREAWSPALADVADLVASADDAALYRLHDDCG